MKKRHILLGLALAATAVFSLAACGSDDKDTSTSTTTTTTTTTTTDGSGLNPFDPNITYYAVTFYDIDGKTPLIETQIAKDSKYALPEYEGNLTDGFKFAGWKDADGNVLAKDTDVTITADVNYYATQELDRIICEEKSDASATSTISYNIDFNNYIGTEVGSGLDIGNVHIAAGVTMTGDGDATIDGVTYKRIKNVKGASMTITDNVASALPSSYYISVEVGGPGKVTAYYAPGGSGDRTMYVIDSNKKVLKSLNNGGQSAQTSVEIEVTEATTLYFCATNGFNFYKIDTEFEAALGSFEGIDIAATGSTDYLEGQALDFSKLSVNKLYSSGATVQMTKDVDYRVDPTLVKTDVPGKYRVNIYYDVKDDTQASGYTEYKKAFFVKIYEATAMDLGFNQTYAGGGSKAGNSQYVNGTVKKIYSTADEELDTNYLNATITGTFTDGTTLDFILSDEELSIDGFTAGKEGEQKISVSYLGAAKELTGTYTINVTSAELYKKAANVYEVTVDASYTGAQGAIVGTDGNTFTSINDALAFIKSKNVDDDAKKILNIKAGTYNEKVEINIPNLTILGAGANDTKIEWDSLYGIKDESGYSQITDSTMTVAVRDTAVNCTIKGVTISNYYNSIEKYADTAYAGSGERGLALLVQSDKFIMEDCSLLGWQDTLELFTGRQYFKDCYISGCVDYIFGTNNTTLFDGCEIHTVKGKSSSNATSAAAHVTAFKGMNKGTSDAIQYGVVFNECDFTADDDFVGVIDMGRCWGSYAAVTVMNSKFDSHFATKASALIVDMNAKKTETTLKFWWYNNTLITDGSAYTVTEDITTTDGATINHTITDAIVAAQYTDFATIFAAKNGGVTYDEAWTPVVE